MVFDFVYFIIIPAGLAMSWDWEGGIDRQTCRYFKLSLPLREV